MYLLVYNLNKLVCALSPKLKIDNLILFLVRFLKVKVEVYFHL